MRSITRNVAIVIVAVVVLLLALGAVPSLLGTGDPHYIEATTVNESGVPADLDPANASTLPERSYPYTFGAIAAAENDTGQSDAYRTGLFGLKRSFSHSPFDEMSAYEAQYPDATRGEVAFVRIKNTTYRLTTIQP
jgi:hypothetical protein